MADLLDLLVELKKKHENDAETVAALEMAIKEINELRNMLHVPADDRSFKVFTMGGIVNKFKSIIYQEDTIQITFERE